MSIQPHTSIFRHQIGSGSEAHSWLHEQQGMPSAELRQVIPLGSFPDTPSRPTDKEPLENGPFSPSSTCRSTGRELRLHIFRDLSCVMLRRGEENDDSWDILPAVLTITSEINDACLKEVPYLDRYAKVPRLRLQARPEGLRWRFIPGTRTASSLTQEDIQEIFRNEMAKLSEEILKAPPVADPRCYAHPPEGSRFAPFCCWPVLQQTDPAIARAKEVVRSLSRLHAHRAGLSEVSVLVQRHGPDTPWRQDNKTPQVTVFPNHGNLERVIREALADPGLQLPSSLRFGPDREQLFVINSIEPATSRHAQIAAHEVLSKTLTSDTWAQAFKEAK